jgi:hypothetical protein
MRFFSLVLVAMASASSMAQASFDMLLLYDRSNSNSRITRYDPVNNINLGGFDVLGDAAGLLVDQPSGTVYTVSRGFNAYSIQRYSIWTGDLVSEVILPGSYNLTSGFGYTPTLAKGANGEGILTLEHGIQRVNLSTGALIGPVIGWPGTDFRTGEVRGVYLGNGEYGMVGETDGSPWTTDRVMLFTSGNTWRASYTMNTGYQSTFMRDINARGNQILFTVSSQENNQEVFMLTRGTNSFTGQKIAGTDSSNRIFLRTEWGHGNDGYVISLLPNTGNYFYNRFSTLSGGMGPERAFTGVSAISDSAIFLAPEPGTMTALGLGALAVLRKRRGRKSG